MATYEFATTTRPSTSINLISETDDQGRAVYRVGSDFVLTARVEAELPLALAEAATVALERGRVVVDESGVIFTHIYPFDNGEIVADEAMSVVEVDLAQRAVRPLAGAEQRSNYLIDWLLAKGFTHAGAGPFIEIARRRRPGGVNRTFQAQPVDLTAYHRASELREHLTSQGVEGAAQDAIVRETAPARHSWRVGQAVTTAIAGARAWLDAIDEANKEPTGEYGAVCYTTTAPALLLALDLAGIGGRDSAEGAGTDRLGPFQGLGKGRKQASDGSTWTAAEEGALTRLLDEVGAGRLVLFPDDDIAGEDKAVLSAWVAGMEMVPASALGLLVKDLTASTLPWFRTMAREGLRMSLGLKPWTQLPNCVEFTGSPKGWGRLLNEIELRSIELREGAPGQNYHVTWTGSAVSHGWTDMEPGEYPANEAEGRSADCIVAPGDYVRSLAAGKWPLQAARAYARDKGWYCGG